VRHLTILLPRSQFAREQGRRSWEAIEQEELRGQKLQGTLTLRRVKAILEQKRVSPTSG
jgi:hypothetical protein